MLSFYSFLTELMAFRRICLVILNVPMSPFLFGDPRLLVIVPRMQWCTRHAGISHIPTRKGPRLPYADLNMWKDTQQHTLIHKIHWMCSVCVMKHGVLDHMSILYVVTCFDTKTQSQTMAYNLETALSAASGNKQTAVSGSYATYLENMRRPP